MAFTVRMMFITEECLGGGKGREYVYQFLDVTACKWLFRAVLKEGRDLHSFNAFVRAFHILVAYRRTSLFLC